MITLLIKTEEALLGNSEKSLSQQPWSVEDGLTFLAKQMVGRLAQDLHRASCARAVRILPVESRPKNQLESYALNQRLKDLSDHAAMSLAILARKSPDLIAAGFHLAVSKIVADAVKVEGHNIG